MTLREMTTENAYDNYKKNGMRILVENGIVKGIIREW